MGHYDEKYRKRAVEYYKEGNTLEKTAKTFAVSETTLKRWKKQYAETGNLKNKPLNRSHKKIDPVKLVEFVDKYPDAYLIEIIAAFECSESAVRKALIRLKITRKKRLRGTKSKTPKK